ncbi:MAG TPA: SDR family oxidoreductase, partial [Anaerolineaceae bacterium]
MTEAVPRTMLITGAAGGVGKATVRVFAQAGWKVIGVDRQEFNGEFPADGLFIRADISDPTRLQEVYEQAHGFTPRLDAVVN